MGRLGHVLSETGPKGCHFARFRHFARMSEGDKAAKSGKSDDSALFAPSEKHDSWRLAPSLLCQKVVQNRLLRHLPSSREGGITVFYAAFRTLGTPLMPPGPGLPEGTGIARNARIALFAVLRKSGNS